MKAGHRPVQVARSVVETAADPAGELVEIEMLAAPTAGRAYPGAATKTPRPRNEAPRSSIVEDGGRGGRIALHAAS
jgi:hypothetical protein